MREITSEEAYKILALFLEKYAHLGTETDYIQTLLLRMQPGDNQSFDPTLWQHWQSAINDVLKSQ